MRRNINNYNTIDPIVLVFSGFLIGLGATAKPPSPDASMLSMGMLGLGICYTLNFTYRYAMQKEANVNAVLPSVLWTAGVVSGTLFASIMNNRVTSNQPAPTAPSV